MHMNCNELSEKHRRSQDFFWGGSTRPTPPSLASVVHTFEAVAGSLGSVSAPGVSRVMGPQSEIKIAKNIGEMTFGGGFLKMLSASESDTLV